MQLPAIYSLLGPIFPKTTLIGLCQKIHILMYSDIDQFTFMC